MTRIPPQFKAQTARATSLSAPVGGWNTRDPRDAMPPQDAVVLDNWFPTQGKVATRNGFSSFSDTLGGTVETLAVLDTGATQRMLAFANGDIWNISAGGAGVSLSATTTNDRWQWVQFDDASGGPLLGLVNGADAPGTYDGSTVGVMTVSGSGLTVADLIGIHVHKNFSFFWEDDSQDFWYSAVDALGGVLTKFPLGRVSGFGGKIVAMGTITVDGGAGIDDFAAFLFSTGDVVVYSGVDPGVDWALQGIFRIGAPLGPRCVMKFGGDLLVMTDSGYQSVAAQFGKERGFQASISDKIDSEVRTVANAYRDNFGWQCLLYPRGEYLLFNVPVSASQWDQHIVNTVTGAWSRFTGQNGACWVVYNNDLYFGGAGGEVWKADDTLNDDGATKKCIAQQAWTFLGDRGAYKRVTSLRPFISVNVTTGFEIGIGRDFSAPVTTARTVTVSADTRITGAGDTRVTSAADTRTTLAGANDTSIDARYSLLGAGRAISIEFDTSDITGQSVDWFSTNVTWEPGSIG